jgi:uridylate kinase
MQDAIVIALGGSLLSGKSFDELESWKFGLVNLVESVIDKGMKIFIVVGGGKLARENIKKSIDNGVDDAFELDLIGIEATRKNAIEVIKLFSDSNINLNQEIPKTIEEGIRYFENKDVVVMGGTVPGHTTDTVAIKIGNELNSKMVIVATNVSHVFTSDPRHNSDAEPIESMPLGDLGALTGVGNEINPGSSFAVDPIGVSIAIEGNLPLVILDGHDVENLSKAIIGESFEGTRVYRS